MSTENSARHVPLSGIVVGALVATVLATASVSTGTAHAADPIPDDGLPAVSIDASPLVSQRTERLLSGVQGIDRSNDSFPNTDIRVTSFAEYDDTIYVGGKFTRVEDAATGNETTQRHLAAFDRDTGAWVDTFRPTLNGNVWDLAVTADGRLIVAGQFTNVNGEADTTAVASLDPLTGAVTPGWRVDLELGGSNDRPLARTLDIDGDDLYVGGNFTRITGSDGQSKNAGRIARVDVASGNAEGAFLPDIDGIVFDIDADGDRVYAAGDFFYVDDQWSVGLAVMSSNDGTLVPGIQPWVRTQLNRSDKWYQQAVLTVGDDVWQAGSQHNRQVYQRSDHALIRSWVSDPWGDGQALAELNGMVYSGSHANGSSRLHRDAISWPGLQGATTSQPLKWMAAFDGSAHEQVAWVPQIGTSHGEGSWALFADSTDCLWTGGDFNRGSYDGDTPRYVSGFAKFCAADTTPPEPPTNPTATSTSGGINLAWTGSTDDRNGEVRYELLKNDSVFASYISITTFRDPNGTADDRYFVRAMDDTGNRSATTRVFTAATDDTTRPSTPQDLAGTVQPNGDVTLTWTASTDNVGVVEYLVLRNGVEIDAVTDPTALIPTPAAGDHWYQVRARDAAGTESFKTPPIQITISAGDTTPPTTPRDLVGTVEANGDVSLTWTPSSDDVDVTGYLVLRNSEQIDSVTDPAAIVSGLASGDHWFQIRAVDAAGNQSYKTPPTQVTISAGDTTPPTTPGDLAGTTEADGDVTLTWTASADDVGVTEYIVFRNGSEVIRVADATAIITAPAMGTHWYQVRAVDAAGNESYKTPPLAYVVEGADAVAPTTPQDLAAAVEQVDDGNGGLVDEITLTWTASTDAVGVTGYLVFRNGVEVANVVDATATFQPGSGSHWYQVRAFDAAGNQSYKTPPLRVDL